MGKSVEGLFRFRLEVRQVPGNFSGPAPFAVVICLPKNEIHCISLFRDSEAEAEEDMKKFLANHAVKESSGG